MGPHASFAAVREREVEHHISVDVFRFSGMLPDFEANSDWRTGLIIEMKSEIVHYGPADGCPFSLLRSTFEARSGWHTTLIVDRD